MRPSVVFLNVVNLDCRNWLSRAAVIFRLVFPHKHKPLFIKKKKTLLRVINWLFDSYVITSCSFYRIYYWYDEKGKKTKCTAPQYVDFVMSLCQKLVTDEEIFPTKYGECPSPGVGLLPPAGGMVSINPTVPHSQRKLFISASTTGKM